MANIRHFKKSTPEEIVRMRELRKQGKTYDEIGKILGKNHASIMYWFRDGIKMPRKKKISYKNNINIPKDDDKNSGKDYADYLSDESFKKKTDSVYKSWLKQNVKKIREPNPKRNNQLFR